MKHFVGNIDDFQNNRCNKLKIGKRNILVWRSNDQFYATREECPHQGVSLACEELSGTMLPSAPKEFEHGLEGRVIRCPWHKWEFDAKSGKALFGTETRHLGTFPVVVEENRIYVEV